MIPYKQGDIDGLCGAYSLINSTRLIVKDLSGFHSMKLLDRIIYHMEQKKKISAVITRGLTASDMEFIMENVLQVKFGIKTVRPFYKRKRVNINVFWKEVLTFFNGSKEQKAVIVGIENDDWDHWTVIESISQKQIRVFDSSELIRIYRSRCTTGKTNKQKVYCMSTENTFFLSKEEYVPTWKEKQMRLSSKQRNKSYSADQIMPVNEELKAADDRAVRR